MRFLFFSYISLLITIYTGYRETKFSKKMYDIKRLVFLMIVISAFLHGLVRGSPKKYVPEDGGFQPSQLRYYESDLSHNNTKPTPKLDAKESKDSSDRLRFGLPISTYGNTGSGVGYPSTNNGMGYIMTPMKIDIGGIALGALIGLGAILIVPKIAHILSATHGYRSLENDMSSVTEVLARIDNSLEQNNIDSSSCMQRIICSYVNDAQKNMKTGEASTVDQFVYTLANNSIFSYMLDGTAVKEAAELGKQGDTEKCAAMYSKCPINRENVLQVVNSLLPA